VPSLTDLTFPLRFMYNLMQVGLCSYMTVEAALLAYRHNYKCVCLASGGHAGVHGLGGTAAPAPYRACPSPEPRQPTDVGAWRRRSSSGAPPWPPRLSNLLWGQVQSKARGLACP
jgi:hypothetical protein